MIKLHASYGLKVPAEQEYSSESFHATAEVELADNLVNQPEALKAALHSLWGDLKAAVAAEIGRKRQPVQPISHDGRHGNGNGHGNHGSGSNGNGRNDYGRPSQPVNRVSGNGNVAPASKKQIGFLLSLTRRKRNFSAEQTRNWLQAERGQDLNALSKSEAAKLIDELNAN